ncbi:hypothetical protein ANCDUO_16485 [Ancylostoma duodenale]|uniref:FAS1 domain-containing protein n=1 Tax=Ancylostoma duodenale TaxID=51022 RepID=A0A0C2FXV3_9BILA|nr:hypothetical protein ANCDUO_16485 [Ancylostoma duodenale]
MISDVHRVFSAHVADLDENLSTAATSSTWTDCLFKDYPGKLWRDTSLNASLSDDKLLTAFVPTDDAFSNNDFKRLISDRKLAETFVKRHIVEEPLCNFDLRRNPGEIRIQTYANLNGEGLRPASSDGEILVDGARVEVPQLQM